MCVLCCVWFRSFLPSTVMVQVLPSQTTRGVNADQRYVRPAASATRTDRRELAMRPVRAPSTCGRNDARSNCETIAVEGCSEDFQETSHFKHHDS